jgi:hypothetical protein
MAHHLMLFLGMSVLGLFHHRLVQQLQHELVLQQRLLQQELLMKVPLESVT